MIAIGMILLASGVLIYTTIKADMQLPEPA
jgi:hypothetical protein